jgi:hypothetical protein
LPSKQNQEEKQMSIEAGFSLRVLLFMMTTSLLAAAQETRATVIYDDIATEVTKGGAPAGLWITTADLKRATRFEVKPQGVCRDELCFPLPKSRQQEFLHKEQGKTWFNLTAFAALVQQPAASDTATRTWYFGLRSDQRQALASLRAPNFTLPDINGKMHSLSDFHGKKILLVTWASW